MKKVIIFVCISLSVFAGLTLKALQRPQPLQEGVAAPAVDVGTFSLQKSPESPNYQKKRINLKQISTIPFNCDTTSFGGLKVGKDGNIFFIAIYPNEGEISERRLMKFNPSSYQFEKIPTVSLQGKPSLEAAELHDFDLDEAGNIYLATANPATILVESAEGKPITQIDLMSMIPHKISVDSDGQIWVAGVRVLGRNPLTFGKSEVRIYSAEGRLVGIPAGGFEEADISLGVLISDSMGTKLITGSKLVTYIFKNQNLTQVLAYPFATTSASEIEEPSSSGNLPRRDKPSDKNSAQRLLFGVSRLKESLLWYGSISNIDSSGTEHRTIFIDLTSPSGEALTSEIKLPRQNEYGFPLGADLQGNIYFASHRDGTMILRKVLLDY